MMKPQDLFLTIFSALICLLFSAIALAGNPLMGEKKISLLDKSGVRLQVGTITFEQSGQKSHYQLDLDHSRFADYFLSMKEMKCLEGPELWCHLAYPYQQPHTVTSGDLRWLEHDLLFMFKTQKEFGANFWNGIYYQLEIKEGHITGKAQAVDLNFLASPPDDLSVPPITDTELDEIDEASRWLPIIEIH